MNRNRVIVLSDGTWETIGEAQILTLTDEGYNNLIEGEYLSISEIEDSEIVKTEDIK